VRLLFVTQQVDPDHPALGATVPKIAALARRVDDVVVLADGAVPYVLPANARVRTFGARTKAGRGARFEAALAAELPGLRGAVVAHMCPIYAVLAAPLVRPLRIPLVLWYTHWRAGPLLRAAERASTAVASVDRRSFPLPSRKVRAIGHGIDVSEFACTDHRGDGTLRLLALGRYSPAKGLDVVVHAVAATDARLTVHGPTLTPLEREHRETLGELIDSLGVGDRIRLEGPVPRAQVPELFAEADLLVNNMRAGAPDKVVYEAAASCLPVLASNPVFDELLDSELRFAREDPDELAARLREFEARDAAARAELGRRLRERVAAHHSADSWAEGILEAAGVL
jgi:glycosyltransferase involved in cell wall biosynthesis